MTETSSTSRVVRPKGSRSGLSDQELWQALEEAEARKADRTLPIDVRVRSFETYSLCLREASNRGYDYAALKRAAHRREHAQEGA